MTENAVDIPALQWLHSDQCMNVLSSSQTWTVLQKRLKSMEFHGTVQGVIFVHIVFHLYRNHQGQIIVVTRGQDPSPHSKGWPISTNYKYFFRAHYSCGGYAEHWKTSNLCPHCSSNHCLVLCWRTSLPCLVCSNTGIFIYLGILIFTQSHGSPS